MNEERRDEEQPIFKVADRRKFNVDGSLREGVQIEESQPKPRETAAPPPNAQTQSAASAQPILQPQAAQPAPEVSAMPETSIAETPEADEDLFDESQIPGAENPASFANFLISLASQAAAALGLSENPASGQRRADLELSRYWLEVLAMLREKTRNNLHPQEQKLFDGLLSDLRMQYVQLSRVAEAQMRKQEEQLMKQAAQKFSGKDILGK